VERDDALTEYHVFTTVATITLDAPERRNALSTRMIAEIRDGLARGLADESVRMILIRHSGPAFCAGADLTESAAATRPEDLPAWHLADLLADMCEAPKPVVVTARGTARGGGLGLLAAADVAVCGADVNMAFSEVRIGVVPAVIAPVVARRIGPARMRTLFLTGEQINAEQALAWGLADGVDTSPGADFDGVMDMLGAGGPAAQAGIKTLTATPDLREGLREAAALTAEYFFSDEGREGVRSFIEKRTPSWVD